MSPIKKLITEQVIDKEYLTDPKKRARLHCSNFESWS
jgi:hypothetical protein